MNSRIAALALTLTTAAGAQVPVMLPKRGMMPAFPAGLIMTVGGEIQKKAAGLPVTLSPFNTPGPIADYSIQAISSQLSGATGLEVDAMSSGNDPLPLLHHESGEFWIYQGTQGTGTPTGWAVLHMAIESEPVWGDAVMGYYFDNPSFPQQLANGIYHELVPADFPGGGIPSSLDIAMGLLADNHGDLEAVTDAVANRVYFSLTPASATALYNHLVANNTLLDHHTGAPYTLAYTGATIFVAEFASDGTCAVVKVREDHVSLQLDPADDIDALAVGFTQPLVAPSTSFTALDANTLQFVFSLDTVDPAEELLVAADVASVRTQDPLRGNNGNDIVGGVGTIGGRVRALCAQDPEGGFHGGSAYGEPDEHGITATQDVLSLSLAARITSPYSATGQSRDQFVLTGVVSGWVGGVAQDSLVYLRMEMVEGPLHGFSTYLDPWFRPASAGHLTFSLPIDTEWVGTSTLADAHKCRFSIHQVGLTQPTLTESFRSMLFRRK